MAIKKTKIKTKGVRDKREEEKLARSKAEREKVKTAVLTLYPLADMIAVDPEFNEITFEIDGPDFSKRKDCSSGDVVLKFESADTHLGSLRFTYIIAE